MNISVKVMLSYDYNHFEVVLSGEGTIEDANELRKTAQRLADEAVRQYQAAKEAVSKRFGRAGEYSRLMSEIELLKLKPDGELTAEERAKVKAIDDFEYWNAFEYDYDDDPDDIDRW